VTVQILVRRPRPGYRIKVVEAGFYDKTQPRDKKGRFGKKAFKFLDHPGPSSAIPKADRIGYDRKKEGHDGSKGCVVPGGPFTQADADAFENDYFAFGKTGKVGVFGDPGHANSWTINKEMRRAANRGPGTIHEMSPRMKKRVAKLKRAFKRARPLKKPVRAYRGMPTTPGKFSHSRTNEWPQLIGRPFEDPAFGSVTGNRNWAESFATGIEGETSTPVLAELNLQPGLRVIYGGNPAEDEVVIEPGAQYVIREAIDTTEPYTWPQEWLLRIDVYPPGAEIPPGPEPPPKPKPRRRRRRRRIPGGSLMD
jgi:hypothetical protein